MMIEPAIPHLTLPLVGRVGARKRAGLGVNAIMPNADPHPQPQPLPTRGRGASGVAQVY
jgi:hypothetical protein